MKSIIIDEYEAKPPASHPANPGLLMLAFEVPGSDETYVFPMSADSAEEYANRLTTEVRKAKGPKIVSPNGEDIIRANSSRSR